MKHCLEKPYQDGQKCILSSSCVYIIYGQNGQNTSYSRYASYLPFQIRHSAVTRQIAIMGHKRMGWKTYGLWATLICPQDANIPNYKGN